MTAEEPVEGFNDYKESLLAKLIPTIDELVLVQMKANLLKARRVVGKKTQTAVMNDILQILKSNNT